MLEFVSRALGPPLRPPRDRYLYPGFGGVILFGYPFEVWCVGRE